jgi:hypothetical protein
MNKQLRMNLMVDKFGASCQQLPGGDDENHNKNARRAHT